MANSSASPSLVRSPARESSPLPRAGRRQPRTEGASPALGSLPWTTGTSYHPARGTFLRRRAGTDQPVPVDSVEVCPDICIDYPVDFPLVHPESQGIERIMRSTSGSEPIAEPEELRLEYRRKDGLRHRLLDDLVLQCGDAQRSCSPVRLRYL